MNVADNISSTLIQRDWLRNHDCNALFPEFNPLPRWGGRQQELSCCLCQQGSGQQISANVRTRAMRRRAPAPHANSDGLASFPNRHACVIRSMTRGAEYQPSANRTSNWHARAVVHLTAYAKRPVRRLDLVGALVLRACNEPERAACCVNDNAARALIGIVHKLVEPD